MQSMTFCVCGRLHPCCCNSLFYLVVREKGHMKKKFIGILKSWSLIGFYILKMLLLTEQKVIFAILCCHEIYIILNWNCHAAVKWHIMSLMEQPFVISRNAVKRFQGCVLSQILSVHFLILLTFSVVNLVIFPWSKSSFGCIYQMPKQFSVDITLWVFNLDKLCITLNDYGYFLNRKWHNIGTHF